MPPDAVSEDRCVPLNLAPGDVAIFGGFTPHRSEPNLSNRWRRQLFLSYNARSDGGQQKQRHYREFHERLRARLGDRGGALFFR